MSAPKILSRIGIASWVNSCSLCAAFSRSKLSSSCAKLSKTSLSGAYKTPTSRLSLVRSALGAIIGASPNVA